MSHTHPPVDAMVHEERGADAPRSPGRRDNACHEEVSRRLLFVIHLLQSGSSRCDIVTLIQGLWGVGERMAQLYVKRAIEHLAQEAGEEDRLFYLKLSQIQRDKLLTHVFRSLEGAKNLEPHKLASLLRPAIKLLETRDVLAAEVCEHLQNGVSSNGASDKEAAELDAALLDSVARRNGAPQAEKTPTLPSPESAEGWERVKDQPQPAAEKTPTLPDAESAEGRERAEPDLRETPSSPATPDTEAGPAQDQDEDSDEEYEREKRELEEHMASLTEAELAELYSPHLFRDCPQPEWPYPFATDTTKLSATGLVAPIAPVAPKRAERPS